MGLISGLISQRWPGGCAPYTYDADVFDDDERKAIDDGVAMINDTGLIRLIKRTTQARYIDVIPDRQPLDGTCWSSHTGMSGARQEVRLDPNTDAGVVAHEFLHALGVMHEHKRPDRDSFIRVNYRDMQLERRGDFDIAHPPGATAVGPYDLDSIMHYGAAVGASVKGDTQLIFTLDPTKQGNIGNRGALSSGDVTSLQALVGGNVMVAGFDANGQIGGVVDMQSWGDGFNIVSPYSIGPSTFVFLLKTSDGRMHIRDVAPSGALGALRDNRDWSSSWTTALPYLRGAQACLLLYKASNGLIRLHTLAANGTVGPMFEEKLPPEGGGESKFEAGWTSIAHYTIGMSDYLFFLKKSSGEMMVHGVGANGGLGQRIQWDDWSSDWTTAQPFTTSQGSFMFLLKAIDGTMNVNRIMPDGKIGPQLPSPDWSAGWTIARAFVVGSVNYLFLLKSATGQVHVNRINADGTIGAIVDRREFGPGWTSGAIVQRGGNAAIVLVKA